MRWDAWATIHATPPDRNANGFVINANDFLSNSEVEQGESSHRVRRAVMFCPNLCSISFLSMVNHGDASTTEPRQ